ncbi:MAG TPA: YifB family Mg chelatase-like AAA ATPase [Phycisphaerae bacterium]|jgi:magnesium chelatase family protein|nr:YifB family Mg chelatase-like AAA ATPase [Phycisphaerae bacterium]
MLAKVHAFVLQGIDAIPCEVEVDHAEKVIPEAGTRPAIVGLPDTAVKESLDRIRSALFNCGYGFPEGKLTINLAPADLRKEGNALELPVALGILSANRVMKKNGEGIDHKKYLVAGELALDGRVRPIKGALSMAMLAREHRMTGVILPADNAPEAAVVPGVEVIPIGVLSEMVGFLNGELQIHPYRLDEDSIDPSTAANGKDFAEVRGQELGKRALTIAAAGRHNLLLLGPPGAGKTMLCERLPSILPPLTRQEALETTRVYSACGLLPRGVALIRTRPVRSPHHTASGPSVIGGGSIPRPGEVSLAHHGILFLDELPEFPRGVLEVLRQPLESGMVTISRAHSSLTFPARFMLVAAMNPSQSGKGTVDPRKASAVETAAMERYMSRLSGPLLDRIDIHLEVPAVTYRDLTSKAKGTTSAQMREQVTRAIGIQRERFGKDGTMTNASMSKPELEKFCELDEGGQALMKQAMEELGLSARAFDKVRKVSRTIADLDGKEKIEAQHVSEAVGYRLLDRKW